MLSEARRGGRRNKTSGVRLTPECVENHDPAQHSIKTRRVGCGQKLQVTITARRYNIVPSPQIILKL